MELSLATTITEVTIYPDRALVTRVGAAQVEAAGEHVLHVGGLPAILQPESLRASGSGPAGMRILGVEQKPEFHAAVPDEPQRLLREEMLRLQREVSLLDEQRRMLDDQQQWLRTLGEQAARSLAWGLARGSAKLEDAGALLTYTSGEAQRLTAAGIEQERRREELTRELEARRREYENAGGGRRPDRMAAGVRIELPATGEVRIELSYLIAGAAWRPRYDARVQRGAATVHLSQQALITQRTGEDWSGVALALSTARPSAAVRLPDQPDPWYLDIVERPPVPPVAAPVPRFALHAARLPANAAASFRAADTDTVPGAPESGEAQIEAPIGAAPAAAEMERSGVAQLFRLAGRGDVPADGSPHLLGIGAYDLPCQFDYVAEPAIAAGAHLRARATNTSGQVLLPGELHIFQVGAAGDEYTGATRLDLTAEGAELPLYLGVDDNLTVKRELVEHETDKGSLLQGGVRRVTLGYRMTLGNRTTGTQHLLLKDRLPLPRHERIKVRTLDVRPQPDARTRLEQLSWELTLAPGEERRVEWRCVVEAPADLEVAGMP